MSIPTTKQSAIEAISVLLTSDKRTEALRVSQTGRVYEAHALTLLFERAGNAICQAINFPSPPAQREATAREAVLRILTRDVRLIKGGIDSDDTSRLQQVLNHISTPSPTGESWRDRLSKEIAVLNDSEKTRALAKALSKLEFYASPVNAPLFRQMRDALSNKTPHADALKSALRSHLVTWLDMSAERAQNASENIHWAMTNFDCDFKEALDIACCAGRMVDQKECLMQRDTAMSLAWMRVKHRLPLADAKAIMDAVDQRIFELHPEGWPAKWEAMPDGSRRLKDSQAFGEEFLCSLKESSSEGEIDAAEGLSSKYLGDAGRMRFRFGRGPTAVVVDLDKQKAIKALTDYVPDAEVRRTLSRCLFQNGLNGLLSSMNALKTQGGRGFWIDSIDPDNQKAETKSFRRLWIDTGENGKIRVDYGLYANHFCLSPPDSDQKVKINSRYDSNKAASVVRHTGRLRVLVEFDVEQLRQGLIEPRLVRDPEVQLVIEPNRAKAVQALFEPLFKQLRQTGANPGPAPSAQENQAEHRSVSP